MPWTPPTTRTTGEVITAAKWNTDLTDNLNVMPRGVHGAHVVGTSGGFGERWYGANFFVVQADGLGNAAVPTGAFNTMPFISPRNGGTIDRIGLRVSAGVATSKARIGIYQATSETNPYPNALIVDSGEFDTSTTGVKSATVSVTLEPDILYWAALLTGTAAPNLVNVLGSVWAGLPIVGLPSTLDSAPIWFTRTQAYGALPSTFPAGPPTTFVAGSWSLLAVRYSA